MQQTAHARRGRLHAYGRNEVGALNRGAVGARLPEVGGGRRTAGEVVVGDALAADSLLERKPRVASGEAVLCRSADRTVSWAICRLLQTGEKAGVQA